MIETGYRGQFLISMPRLRGDYFERTVTLMVEHSASGAFGLVVNKPNPYALGDFIPELAGVEIPVLEGGPVEQDRLFFLHSGDRRFDSSLALHDDAVLTTSSDLIELLLAGDRPEQILALVGYAGWGAGQLDDEVANNAWLLAPYSATILYDSDHARKPNLAAAQLGIDINLISPDAGHG